jgi:hypothetical protein
MQAKKLQPSRNKGKHPLTIIVMGSGGAVLHTMQREDRAMSIRVPIATFAVHDPPAAAQPLKAESDGTSEADDTSDEEAAELHRLLQQISDPAVRCRLLLQTAMC